MAPPEMTAVFDARVQLVTVTVPFVLHRPPPKRAALLLLKVQPISVTPLALWLNSPPPLAAVLPLTVQSVRTSVPLLIRPPPSAPKALPPVIVSPDIAADAPLLTWNTRSVLLPLIVTPAAGPVIVVVAASVSVSWPPVRVIVCGVLNTVLSKVIVSAPGCGLA